MTDRAEALAGVEDVDLSGRTVLVTGSTDGIGREAALALGRLGATVVVHGRDRGKGRAVVDGIEAGPGTAELLLADFASLDAVAELADEVAALGPLDALLNNAGGYFQRGRLTDDGFEYTFGVNHLAPFLLTNRLRPHLAPGARVVTTASAAHRGANGIDFGALRSVDDYGAMRAYARSKLANVCFAAELARRLEAATSNSFHPGFVPGSGFGRELPRPVYAAMRALARLPAPLRGWFSNSVVEGAATAVHLAASPAVEETGRYFVDCEPATPTATARDRELQAELWARSADWVGLDAEAD